MNQALFLKDRVSQMICREVDRCKAKLGSEGWKQHGEWVTENIVAGAKQWLLQQASKGAL
jgi:hypothetical protein